MKAYNPLHLFLGALPYALPALGAEPPGRELYDSVCATCHATGVSKAPVFGDRKKWKKLASEGFDDLVGSALVGIRAMPAKGGKPDLDDMQVAQAVHYMVFSAGAKFPEPTQERVAQARAFGEKRKARHTKSAGKTS